MNLFDFAMKMEMDGKAYYEKLATDTPVAGLRTIFTMLAADEQKHYDAVQAMKTGSQGQWLIPWSSMRRKTFSRPAGG